MFFFLQTLNPEAISTLVAWPMMAEEVKSPNPEDISDLKVGVDSFMCRIDVVSLIAVWGWRSPTLGLMVQVDMSDILGNGLWL